MFSAKGHIWGSSPTLWVPHLLCTLHFHLDTNAQLYDSPTSSWVSTWHSDISIVSISLLDSLYQHRVSILPTLQMYPYPVIYHL